MNAHPSRLMLAIILFISAPASAQWMVHVQDQTGAWKQNPKPPDRDLDGTVSEPEAQAHAGRFCIARSMPGLDPTLAVSRVKIVGPGMTLSQVRALTCDELGEIMGEDLTPHDGRKSAPASSKPPATSAVPSYTQPVFHPSTLPSVNELRRNPLGALQKLVTGRGMGSRAPANSSPRPSDLGTFDVVGLQLGMAPSAADSTVREQMRVGWVFVRDRSKRPVRATTYESMKGYLASDLSEAILLYFEPSLAAGTLVGVRRFSMIGQKVDPAALEASLLQKYGHPAVAGKNTWVWGQPSGCAASETSVLKPQDLTFLEGPARSDAKFTQALASALDLATYHSMIKREYWARCRPVLQVLKTANNGVMTTLADQKFTMDRMAPERYDHGAIKF